MFEIPKQSRGSLGIFEGLTCETIAKTQRIIMGEV